MNALKRIAALILVLAMTAALAACGGKSVSSIDAQALANELMEKVDFVDELNQISPEMVSKLYGIDNAEESYVYMGSGATAEEVAVRFRL